MIPPTTQILSFLKLFKSSRNLEIKKLKCLRKKNNTLEIKINKPRTVMTRPVILALRKQGKKIIASSGPLKTQQRQTKRMAV